MLIYDNEQFTWGIYAYNQCSAAVRMHGMPRKRQKETEKKEKKKALHELPYINTVKTELKDRGSDAVQIDNYFAVESILSGNGLYPAYCKQEIITYYTVFKKAFPSSKKMYILPQ